MLNSGSDFVNTPCPAFDIVAGFVPPFLKARLFGSCEPRDRRGDGVTPGPRAVAKFGERSRA